VDHRNGNFSVFDDAENGTDCVQACDGAAVTHLNLGGDYTGGQLVVQNGRNSPSSFDADGEKIDSANFKFIRWDDIAEEMGLLIHNP